jgi:Protein-tyrosine-phosphatase
MKILFVCSGNTCRSPMAQALMQKILEEESNTKEIKVFSAGLHAVPGQRASKEALEAMGQYSIDLSNHRAQALNRQLIEDVDLILTMTHLQCMQLRNNNPGKKGFIYTLSEYARAGDYDVDDPYGLGLGEYLRTAEELQKNGSTNFTTIEQMM